MADLTIDELARRVGMTVRNLREWRKLGLLDAPVMRGRVGYYPPETVQRIERMQALHADGYPLDLIRRLHDDEAVDLAHALRDPFSDAAPPRADPETLRRLWGSDDQATVARALELGLIREHADGGYEFANARVARVGEAMAELGLDGEQALDAAGELRTLADGMAELMHRLWREHVWEPFVARGHPEAEWPAIQAAVERYPPGALEAVVGVFEVAMREKIETEIARELDRA